MQVDYWLRNASIYLQSRAITTARLDCLVLLEDVLRLPRAKFLAEPDTIINDLQVNTLQKLLNRRARYEPLAYIRNKTEFYGREFIVGPGVLVPRPESESMIELLLGIVRDQNPRRHSDSNQPEWYIADVGAGSGALGITAALDVQNARVQLLEIDPQARKIAKTNVDKYTSPILVTDSDLLSGMNEPADILLCNLPYVPDDYPINKAAGFEPKIALFGGTDGLDLFRRLYDQILQLPIKPLYILTESLPESHSALTQLAQVNGYSEESVDGFVQLFALT